MWTFLASLAGCGGLSAHAIYVSHGEAETGAPELTEPTLGSEAAESEFGTMIISEIVAHPDPLASFIELRNESQVTASLGSDWHLRRYPNGPDNAVDSPLPAVDLAPGEALTIAADVTGFLDTWGVNARAVSQVADLDGTDAIELTYTGMGIDVYGEIGVDGAGENWAYAGQVAARREEVHQGTPAFVLGDWTLSSDPATASPGL